MIGQVQTVPTAATSSGSVSAGAIAVGFVVGSGGSAIIDGVIVLDSSVSAMNYPMLYQGNSYGEIPYTISAGTLYILEVR